jgi:hypothetical protein
VIFAVQSDAVLFCSLFTPYARTVAGVHYPTDNVAGLKMGQEVLSHTLPGHLQERYGCDPVAVAAKIATLRFDWADFAKTDCAKLY